MTTQTEIHRQIFGAHGDGLLRDVTVALLAIHAGVDVRRMPKTNVALRIKPVDALPGNILAFVSVRGEFLDLRIVQCDGLVTSHAKADVWNSGVWALRHSFVTVSAINVVLQVDLVVEGDGLDRSRLPADVFLKCVCERGVRGRENSCVPCPGDRRILSKRRLVQATTGNGGTAEDDEHHERRDDDEAHGSAITPGSIDAALVASETIGSVARIVESLRLSAHEDAPL